MEILKLLLNYYQLDAQKLDAFMLSFYASMGTFVGGVLVVFLVLLFKSDASSDSTLRLMGVLQAISAGVMIEMTAFHLMPECFESLGPRESMIYFFIGIFCFLVLELFISSLLGHEHEDGKAVKKGERRKDKKSLYKSGVVTFIAMALHNIPEGVSVYLAALSNHSMVLYI